MPEVALYARISEDPNDTHKGVGRQREDCRAIAERKGWTVVTEYVDNDLSAYRKSVVRPRFEEMVSALADGDLDGAVVYDLDRLVRQPRDLERLIDIYESSDLVFASAEGDIDLQSSSGRTLARVMTAFANKSSSDTGRRVARAHLELARDGKPVGTRVFGWTNHTDLDPVEAPIAREGIDMVLAGQSLGTVSRRFAALDAKTVRGNDWGDASLRYYFRNPRLAGMRTYRGEIMLDESRVPVLGLWEPLIGVDVWDRLQTFVRKPDTRSRIPRRGGRRYLLTGMLHCGVCGGHMYGNDRGGDKGHVYKCDKKSHNSITGAPVDEFISELTIRALQEVSLDAQPEEWSGEQRLAEVTEQIGELMEQYTSGALGGGIVLPAVQRLEQEQLDMQKGRTQWLSATGPASAYVSPDEWESFDSVGKRAVVDSLLEGVMIRKATQRGTSVDLARIEPLWRQPQSKLA